MVVMSLTVSPAVLDQSDTQNPLCPYWFQVRLDAIKRLSPVPREVWEGLPIESGIGFPSSLVSAGLGSNKSTWLGPPSMKSQITAFAVGGLCGAFGAKGSTTKPRPARPSPASRSASATPASPLPARVKNSRPVTTVQ